MIKQFVPQEVCLACQGCCRFKEAVSVWSPCLLDAEIQDLLERKDLPAASLSVDRRIMPVANSAGEGFCCPFLKVENNYCQIYALRPFECQLYPFLLNLRKDKVLLTVDLNCPYLCEKINTPEARDYIAYLSAYLNSPEQIRVLKDNPQIIQAYEDVREVAELRFPHEAK